MDRNDVAGECVVAVAPLIADREVGSEGVEVVDPVTDPCAAWLLELSELPEPAGSVVDDGTGGIAIAGAMDEFELAVVAGDVPAASVCVPLVCESVVVVPVDAVPVEVVPDVVPVGSVLPASDPGAVTPAPVGSEPVGAAFAGDDVAEDASDVEGVVGVEAGVADAVIVCSSAKPIQPTMLKPARSSTRRRSLVTLGDSAQPACSTAAGSIDIVVTSRNISTPGLTSRQTGINVTLVDLPDKPFRAVLSIFLRGRERRDKTSAADG